MEPLQRRLRLTAFWLVFSAAVAPLVSIAVSHILIGASLAALIVSRADLRFPPLKLPLGLFILGTVVSLSLSTDPAAGLPQLRKLYVFLTLVLVYSAFRSLSEVNRLTRAWIVVAAASAGVGIVQFVLKYREAVELGVPFYEYYVGSRMTGFMSHWQTFGGEMMLVFSLTGAFILFSPLGRRRTLAWLACSGLLAAAIVLGFTRNIWLGAFAAGLYLLWFWRPKLILLAPLLVAAVLAFGPESLRDRFTSVVRPHGEVDSNQHRVVTYRTGWNMIKANPILGVGPEQVAARFEEFVPADVPRPLPEGWYGHLHNVYLHYAAERGIPVMLCLLWFIGRALVDFWRALRRNLAPEGRYFLHGAIAAIIAILCAGFFELNLGDTEVLTIFLAILAAGYSVIGAGASTEKQNA